MLKNLFGCSVILAAFGVVLIWSASPDISKTILNKAYDQVSTLTSTPVVSMMPENVTPVKCGIVQNHPYHISLIGMQDYYNVVPTFGTFVR